MICEISAAQYFYSYIFIYIYIYIYKRYISIDSRQLVENVQVLLQVPHTQVPQIDFIHYKEARFYFMIYEHIFFYPLLSTASYENILNRNKRHHIPLVLEAPQDLNPTLVIADV